MRVGIILLLGLACVLAAPLDDDKEFLEKYQVSVKKRGTFTEFPQKGD